MGTRRFETDAPRRIVTPLRLMIAISAVLAMAVIYVIAAGGEATAVGMPGRDVSFAVSEFEDGVARFYTHTTADGRRVRFFVMKSADGVIRAAFDACDTCFQERRGYRQDGDVMVCNNCNRTFHSNDINVLQGGCNPAPIQRSVVGGRVVLAAASLTAGASYF